MFLISQLIHIFKTLINNGLYTAEKRWEEDEWWKYKENVSIYRVQQGKRLADKTAMPFQRPIKRGHRPRILDCEDWFDLSYRFWNLKNIFWVLKFEFF
jgi:hypothetical protein